jgi:hypothetical protein
MLLSITLLLALAAPSDPAPSGLPIGISIGSSPSAPCWGCDNDPPFVGDKTLYVWFGYDRFESIVFDFTGTFLLVDFEPAPGFTNVGKPLSPVLIPDESCSAEQLSFLGELTVRDETGAGGAVWVKESTSTSQLCFRECWRDGWFWFEYFGYATVGIQPWGYSNSIGCQPLPVDPTTWGQVKGRYR